MTDQTRKIQLATEVDATGARQGFEDIKQGARDMAQAVGQAGQQAGQSIGGIGNGAGGAAQKLDAATRSIIGSIQRATAAMQAGEKGSASFYEALAKSRGIDTSALRQYTDELRKVEAAQKAAAQGLKADAFVDNLRRQVEALGKSRSQLLEMQAAQLGVSPDKIAPYIAALKKAEQGQTHLGKSAKELEFALRGVPAQFTDIAVALQSGQRPLTVLLQQGGQLKDMFGGIGPAARALGGYIVSLVGPFTIAATAVAALGYAMFRTEQNLRASNGLIVQLQATGRSAEISAEQAKALGEELQRLPGMTKEAANATILEFTRTRQIGTALFRDLALSVADFAAATGSDAPTAARKLAQAFADPLKGAKELDAQLGILTATQVVTIQKMVELGDRSGAQRVLFDALTTRVKGLANEGLTPLQRSANDLGNAWDKLQSSLERSQGLRTINELLAKAITGTANLIAAADKVPSWMLLLVPGAGLPAYLARKGEPQFKGSGATGSFGDAAPPTKGAGSTAEEQIKALLDATASYKSAGAAMDDLRDKAKALRGALDQLRASGKGDSVEAKELADRLKGVNERLAGMANVGQSEVAGILAKIRDQRALLTKLRTEGAGADQPTEGEKLVTKIQQELATSITGVARAEKERALAAAQTLAQVDREVVAQQKLIKGSEDYRKLVDATQAAALATQRQADQQEAVNASFGKSKTAIEELRLAHLRSSYAIDQEAMAGADYLAGLDAQIDAQKRYVQALQEAEYLQERRKLEESSRSLQEEADSLKLEVSLLGVTQQEREKIIAQRKVEVELAKELADIDKLNLGTGDQADQRRQELRDKATANARVKAEQAVQRTVLDDWQRTSDQINQSLTDALMRGFESGKGFAQNLRDTLKNLFGTLVLRPVIQAVMAPISGSLVGFGQSIGSAVTGGGGSVLGAIGNLGSSLGGLFGGGSALGSLSYAAAVPGLTSIGAGSQAAMLAAQTADFGLAGLGATASAGGAGILGGALSGVGAALPWIGGALAIASLLGVFKKGGGPKQDGVYGQLASGIGLGERSASSDSAARTAALSIQSQYDSIVKAYGGTGGIQYGLGFSMDPKGTSQSFLDITGSRGGKTAFTDLNLNAGRSQEELQAAITEMTSRALLKGLQESNLSGQIGAWIDSLNIDALSSGELAADVERLNKAMGERQTLEEKLYQLTHTEAENLAHQREQERAALDETNRALYDHVAALTDLTNTLATQREALVQAYQSESAQLQSVIDRNKQYAQQLRDARDALFLGSGSTLTRSQQTAFASASFGAKLSAAIGGNEDALQGLSGAGTALIEAARQSAKTPVELAAAVARVQAGLTTAAASADSRASVAQQQLDAMTQQLSALGLINTSVLSVGDALAAYLATQNAISQENLNYTAELAKQQSGTTTTPTQTAPTDETKAATKPTALSFQEWVTKYGGQYYTGSGADQYDLYNSAYQQYLSLFAVRGYAGGGLASGVVKVGEQGTEVIDLQTPGRVYTSEQTRGMFASNAELVPLLREILTFQKSARQEERMEAAAIAAPLAKMDSRWKKFDNQGMPPVRA